MEQKSSKIKQWTGIWLLLVFCLCLTGCWGGRETDEVAIVLAMGIDKAKNKPLEVTVTIAIPGAFAGGVTGGGGEGGGAAESFFNTSVQGANVWECVSLLNTYIGREILLEHTRVFIFGEELAREGLNKPLMSLLRNREVRGNSTLYISRGKARNFLEMNMPLLEVSPAKYYELMERSSRLTGLFPQRTLNDFNVILKSQHNSPTAIVVGANHLGENQPQGMQGETQGGGGQDQQKQQQLDERAAKSPSDNLRGMSYYAGEVPRLGGNQATLMGSAVFRHDKMVGMLTGVETRTMLLLQGEFNISTFVMRDPQHPGDRISLRLRQAKKPDIKMSVQDGRLRIDETIYLEGEYLAISSGENYEEPDKKKLVEAAFNQEMEEIADGLIAKTRNKDWGDIFRWDRYYRKQLRSWQEWENLRWKEIYDEADVHVTFKTNIRRPGLLRKTESIGKE
ncbi:MAG: Ger(x)C family spore germination protein [Bacillota bacterium]